MKKYLIIGAVLLLLIVGFIMKKPSESIKSDYPLPNSVKNLTKTGENGINFQSNLSLDQVESFYREELIDLGLTERTLLTVKSDTTLSFVFDGHSSGMALVVQAVKLDGETNVGIRLEDI